MDDATTTGFSMNPSNPTGILVGFYPTVHTPYLACASSRPAPSYLCFAASDLPRAVIKVKYTFFLFSLFRNQGSLAAHGARSITKVKYTLFLL